MSRLIVLLICTLLSVGSLMAAENSPEITRKEDASSTVLSVKENVEGFKNEILNLKKELLTEREWLEKKLSDFRYDEGVEIQKQAQQEFEKHTSLSFWLSIAMTAATIGLAVIAVIFSVNVKKEAIYFAQESVRISVEKKTESEFNKYDDQFRDIKLRYVKELDHLKGEMEEELRNRISIVVSDFQKMYLDTPKGLEAIEQTEAIGDLVSGNTVVDSSGSQSSALNIYIDRLRQAKIDLETHRDFDALGNLQEAENVAPTDALRLQVIEAQVKIYEKNNSPKKVIMGLLSEKTKELKNQYYAQTEVRLRTAILLTRLGRLCGRQESQQKDAEAAFDNVCHLLERPPRESAEPRLVSELEKELHSAKDEFDGKADLLVKIAKALSLLKQFQSS